MATRRTPKAPIFIRTPACTMLTPVGAATCPTGDQVCKGQTPARIPNPRKSSKNANFCAPGLNIPGCMSDTNGKRVHAGLCVKENDGRQNQGASRQQIEGQLHGPVFFSGRAPNRDQQVHGKEGDVIPDEYEEEVHAHEKPEYAGYQQEIEGKEFLYPGLEFPHSEHAGKEDNARQQQIWQAESIDGVKIIDAQRWNPWDVFHELKTAKAFVKGQKQKQRQKQRNPGENSAHPLDQRLSVRRDQHNSHHPDNAAQQNGGKIRECGGSHAHRAISSDYRKEEVNCKKDHDREYYQQPVLNHSRLQKGDYPAAIDRCPAQFIDASVNYLVVILIAEEGYSPVNDPVYQQFIKTIDVPSLCEKSVEEAESSPQNRFALHHGGRIQTTPERLRQLQDTAPPYGTMQKLPL